MWAGSKLVSVVAHMLTVLGWTRIPVVVDRIRLIGMLELSASIDSAIYDVSIEVVMMEVAPLRGRAAVDDEPYRIMA